MAGLGGMDWTFDTPDTRQGYSIDSANLENGDPTGYAGSMGFNYGQMPGVDAQGNVDYAAAMNGGWSQTPQGFLPNYDPNNVYGVAYGPGNMKYTGNFDANNQLVPGSFQSQSMEDPEFGMASAALEAFLGGMAPGPFSMGELSPMDGAAGATSFGAGGWDQALGAFTGPSETAQSILNGGAIAQGANGASALSGVMSSLGLPPSVSNLLTGNTMNNAIASTSGLNMNPGYFGQALKGLGGIYAATKAQDQYGSMLKSLQDLYSQNSPYAQALRNQLDRRDAAAGRRSQYGPREVELQAQLARMASGQIPAMSALQGQVNNNRNAAINQGLQLFQNTGLAQKAGNYLQNLFSGNSSGIGGGDLGVPFNYGSDGGGFSMPDTSMWNMQGNQQYNLPDLSSLWGG